MKKILALTISSVLVLVGSGAATAATAITRTPLAVPQTEVSLAETQQNNLYLVPGTYMSGGVKVENTISSGAAKLTQEQCEEIYTDNAYICTLSQGATLPEPSSKRVDSEGNAYTFNGWWMIVDATVTYFKTVPAVTETTFLYADWRADLSQRMDPVIPEGVVEVEPDHYLMIKRAATGETEKITLRKSFTNMNNAESLGYLYPVELYAEGFELNPDDVITVYTTGLTDSEEAVITPVLDSNNSRHIQLESSGDGLNVTADYLTCDEGSLRRDPTLTCITEQSGYYNIYIKYYSKGTIMAVYMETKA